MTEAQLTDLEQNTELYASKIKKKVDELLEEHEAKMFRKWVEQDVVQCQPMYHLKESISPTSSIASIPKSLYEEEDGDLNDYEKKWFMSLPVWIMSNGGIAIYLVGALPLMGR